MADNDVEDLSSFTKAGIVIGSDRQQFCHCCQNAYVWDYGVATESTPAALACGHSLCLNCVKAQWLDVTTQDGTVFCLQCSKRVAILHLKNTEKDLHQSLCDAGRSTDMSVDGYSESTSVHLFSESTEQVCEDKIMSDDQSLSIRREDDANGVWTLEQKHEMPLPEWVNTNICENFVLKLITSATDTCLTGNALTLYNSASMVSSLMDHASISHNGSSLPDKQEMNSEKTVLGYIVDKSGSETVTNNADFPNSSEDMPVQANMLGSPDFNLKALLQMLEKNSLPSLGASTESNEINHDSESFNSLDSSKEEIQCFEKSQNVCENHGVETDSPVMSEKQLCEDACEDDWLPVGIVQNGSFIPNKEKLTIMQTLSCAEYLPNGGTISADDYIYINRMTPPRSSQEMDKVTVDSVSHAWFPEAHRDIPHKSNPRSRRGRKRKPLMRHYQSELFMRPYLKREQSPQLQLVKLVRQRAQDRKDESEKAIAATVNHGDRFHHKNEVPKRNTEDPELAFMKTVDMPSGKRVEDIYVVPSVWISNERRNSGKANCSREAVNFSGANFCDLFPLEGNQRVPLQVYPHGSQSHILNTYQAPYWRQFHGPFGGCQSAPPPSYHNPTRKGLHSTSVSNTHTFKPTHNLYKVIRGHIITTLNAAKIEPVPSLKDLCKSVLGLDTVAAISQMRENNRRVTEHHTVVHHSLIDNNEASREMSSEIKTPKEFIDMLDSATQQEVKLLHMEKETEHLDTESMKDSNGINMFHKDSVLRMNSTTSTHCKMNSKLDLYGKMDRLSDNEDTLPENPLFTEDRKTDGMKTLTEHLHAKMRECSNTDHHFKDQSRIYPILGSAGTVHVQDNFKSLYPAVNSNIGLRNGSNDYVIPIVSYKLTDTNKNCYTSNPKLDHQNSDCLLSRDDNVQKRYTMGSFNIPTHSSSSYPTILDDPYSDDTFDNSLVNLPSLISITKEVKSLSSVEPLNKPLANLTAALNLLCSAEKTLCNSSFVMYRQIKSETKSKLGRLNLCIRKLGDFITTIGGTLQEWMKETNSQCFKTVGVLTELYNSNIISLIDLITPYFHYICELIASCHSEVVPWNKQESSVYDQSKNLAGHQSVTTVTRWLDTNVNNPLPCRPGTLNAFAYTENHQCISPNKRQDYDHSLLSNGGSETSQSDQGSANVSPKVKGLSTLKRGRPLAFNNGQKRATINLRTKPNHVLSPMGTGRCNQESDFTFGGNSTGQPSLLLSSAVLGTMSSDSIWSSDHPAELEEPQNSVSHLVTGNISDSLSFEKPDQLMVQIPTSSTTWVLPPSSRDSSQSIPVQLNISDVSDGNTLSLLDSEIHSIIDDRDTDNVGDTKDTSNECSPSKKIKFDHDESHADVHSYSDIVGALPEGISIVVSSASSETGTTTDASTTDMISPHDSTVDGLNICSADLRSLQNIYFIHSAENPDDYLQLDPHELSAALLTTLKGSKDPNEQFEIAMMRDVQNDALTSDVKEKVNESQSVLDLDTQLDGDGVGRGMCNGFSCGVASGEDTDNL